MGADIPLDLRFFGGFALTVEGRPLGLGGGRLPALLAYLVLHSGGPCSRMQIAAAFWPDVAESNGRNNLRQLLHQLRQAWPEHERVIATDARSLEWRGGEAGRVDVLDFEHQLAVLRPTGRSDRRLTRDALVRIAALYRGALLPDCYDDWIVAHRERLHRNALQVLDSIVRLSEEEHDQFVAVAHAERLLALDPLDEQTYLRLMRLHALSGDQAAARNVYQACVETLRRELGVAPGEEIRDAHRRLMRYRDARSESMPGPAGRESSGEPVAPLVGRTPELRALQDAWRSVAPNAAMLALVTGEAGLGKTRLGEELLNWAAIQGIAVAHTRAYAAEGNLAFSPVTGWLRSEPLRESLARLDPLWRTEAARIVPELLIEQPDLPRPAPLAEYWQRQRFFEALARAVTSAAPALMLMMDDLQWCDSGTLEWLHYLLRFVANKRLLVLGTVRIDEVGTQHPVSRLATAMRRDGRLLELRLSPLDAAETARLASAVAGADVDADAAFHLYSQTEGNPLFVVETVRAGLPALAANTVTGGQSLPPKVQAVINWRLGQLSSEAGQIAGLAATMGRVFSIDILAAASDLGEARVARALDELWQRRIVRSAGPEAGALHDTWDFTHDRLREVAGSMLNPLQRQWFNLRIAEALERLRGDDLDGVSAPIAAHFEQAHDAARALPYYERAARVAARLFAYEEVERLLRRALALLGSRPEGAQAALELRLQLALYAALRVMAGWTSPALEPVHARVGELARAAGDAEQRATALLNLGAYWTVRGDFRRVQSLLTELPAAMAGIESPVLRVMAFVNEIGASLHQGRLAQAEAAFQASVGIYQPQHHRAHVELIGADYEVINRAWSAHGLWCQGLTEEAMARSHDALALARSLNHPFSEAFALTYLAMLHQMAGDVERTRTLAAEAFSLSEHHRVPYYVAWTSLLLAWSDAVGHPGDATRLAALRRCIEEFVNMGAGVRVPFFYCLLAALMLEGGAAAPALEIVDLARAFAARGNNLWWDSELHRVRGQILQRLGGRDTEARSELVRAVAAAREQGAARLEQWARESLEAFDGNGRPNA